MRNLWNIVRPNMIDRLSRRMSDEEYGVRKTVKKLNPRKPNKRRERGSREDALAVSQLVTARRQRAEQGGVQRSQEGSRGSGGALGFRVHGR